MEQSSIQCQEATTDGRFEVMVEIFEDLDSPPTAVACLTILTCLSSGGDLSGAPPLEIYYRLNSGFPHAMRVPRAEDSWFARQAK